jgi:hypothetical protein
MKKSKKQDFAVMRVETFTQTTMKIVQAVDAGEAQRIGESMKSLPDLKKLSLCEYEVTVLGPEE